MRKNFRNRRDLATQLGSIIYAAERLIFSKGRFRGQFGMMDKTMQRDFIKLLGFTNSLKIKYEAFLLEHKPSDLPEYLKGYSEGYEQITK